MISAGLAALTTPAVVDCLATLGITMTSFPDRGYAISEHPVSWQGYDRFLGDDFFQGLGERRADKGVHGSVVYDERGWPFPTSAGLPDLARKILGPVTAWPHLAAMRDTRREESVEWVPPSVSSLGASVEREETVPVAWHPAVFFSAWLGWKVRQQTGTSVYFRLPTLAERGYPLRKRLGLSGDDRLVELFEGRGSHRSDFGSTLGRWPSEPEWLIDGRHPSGTELTPGYRLIFLASGFVSSGREELSAGSSQSQVWEDIGGFRVAVGRDPLPPLAVIP